MPCILKIRFTQIGAKVQFFSKNLHLSIFFVECDFYFSGFFPKIERLLQYRISYSSNRQTPLLYSPVKGLDIRLLSLLQHLVR